MIRRLLFTLILFSACRKAEPIHVGQLTDSVTQHKPNIIFILGDDVGYELPTYTGGQSYSTPNIDWLAANGKQFSFAHACPMCSPTRVELMTGKYGFRNYIGWGVLPETEPTFVQKLHDDGYKTCVIGKWQLDGGDAGIRHAGFDSYSVDEVFFKDTKGNKYKNPEVYENGAYLPTSFTDGKYGDDIFRDYMFDFIDSNRDNPFFVYWPMNLIHVPMQPTPDDPEFPTYNPDNSTNVGELKYYPSMIKYMDKQIGLLVNKLYGMQLLENTLIIFVGDNGSSNLVKSKWNGKWINGEKGGTGLYSTHVPMIAYWLGTIMPSIDTSLIDFSDFMPTILDAAKVSTTGIFTDGVSFYKQLLGQNNSSQRDWIYFWFKPNLKSEMIRWVMDRKYKKYDSTTTTHLDSLINYQANPKNERGILNLNPQMKKRDSVFKSVLNTLQ